MRGPTKAWMFLLLLSMLIVLAGHTIGDRQGLLWSVSIALSINSFIYFYGDIRLHNTYPGRQLEGQDPWGLLELCQAMASRIRIPAPKIYLIDETSPQCFALGRSWKNGKIFLTKGLLDRMSKEELKAVLAYEMTAIKKLDTLAFTVAGALCDVVLSICGLFDIILRWIIGAKSDPYSNQSHLFTLVVAPIAGSLVRLTVGNQIYYNNDALASELCGDPRVLATVLWKLDSYAATYPLLTPPAMAHLFIVNPLTNRGWTRYFHAQPSVERRIRKLVGYYPI